MKIQVTVDDIMNGKRRCPTECPLSIAIKRATGRKFIMVGTMGYYTGVLPADNLIEFHNEKVSQWIVKLDNDEPVEPFEFEISERV